MTGVGVDVQLGFDVGFLVFEVEGGHAFGDVGPVAVTAGNEQWRHAFLDGEEMRSAGIDEGLEVRAGTGAFDGIGVV